MTYFIFAGDMLVMLFMIVLIAWLVVKAPDKDISATARIPLEDERRDG